MTYKYYDIRRDIYESCSDKGLKGFRTLTEMKNLFKTFHWIMLALLLLSLVAMVVILLCPINELWSIIPSSVLFLCAIIMEYKFDSLLDKKAKKEEQDKYNDAYNEYIGKIEKILLNNGIDSLQKRTQLKKECSLALEKHESKYAFTKSKAFDFFIGVPIGALISSFMYKESNTLINETIMIMLIGIIVVFLVKLIRIITFYSDGYWKDKKLLNVLNEIEYSISDNQS